MENGSKALIIIGGVLLAMVVLGMIIFVRGRLSSYQDEKDKAISTEQMAKFNSQFEAYNKRLLRGTEFISVSNLAIDSNKKYPSESTSGITASPVDDTDDSSYEGYKNIIIYAKLENDAGRFPGQTSAVEKKNLGGKKYYNMNQYMNNIYPGLSLEDKNDVKGLYFTCRNVVYDNKNGRIRYMYFEEVKKIN